jgi:hypothetical protein
MVISQLHELYWKENKRKGEKKNVNIDETG